VAGFDGVADVYDESRGGVRRARGFALQLGQLLERAHPVLDVGVGTGIVAHALRSLGFAVVGVDIAPAMLRRAHERLGGGVLRADAARLPFADSAFRQATAVWLLHVVADRPAVFAELARVLAPGGHLLAMTARSNRGDDPVGRILTRLEDQVGALSDADEALAPEASACGLEFVGRRAATAKIVRDSPARVADGLERGLFSATWRGNPTAVAAACAELRALPDAFEERDREIIDHVLVFVRRTAPFRPAP